MKRRDPRQVVVILDAIGETPVEEVIARLPERDEPVRIYRLSECGGGAMPSDRPLTAADWARQADAVTQLVEEAQPAADEAVEYFIWGHAPLPLFVQLGQEMSDWTAPLTFLSRHGDGTWDELPTHAAPQRLLMQPRFFDLIHGLDGPSEQDAERQVSVFVSNRAPADPSKISRFLGAQGENLGALVEIRTRNFRSLDRASGVKAAAELQQALTESLPRKYPQSPLVLFVAGQAVLAFFVGRAVPKRIVPQGLLVPNFDRHEYRPALSLPWQRSEPLPEEEPAQITVLLAYVEPSKKELPLHEQIEAHLLGSGNSRDFVLEVVDCHRDITAGQDRTLAVRHMLERADLVVALISAEFRGTDLGHLVEQYLDSGHRGLRIIPIVERPFNMKGSPWERIELLPRDGRPLRKHPQRELALTHISEDVQQRAQELAASRKLDRGVMWPRATARITATSPHEMLDEIETELLRLPRLRFTFDQRNAVWERLVDYLDRQQPQAKLKERITAASRERFEQGRRFHPKLQEPTSFRPDDPLGAVLDLLDEQTAKRWLYLGAVEVYPQVYFPRSVSSPSLVDLVKRLYESYAHLLTNDERRNLAQIEFLHSRGCSGLLAAVSRQHSDPSDELQLAVELLEDFRQGKPLPEQWRGRVPESIQSVALLNLLGAEALWRFDLNAGERAYLLAQQQANVDRNWLAEWVAVNGLITTMNWASGTHAETEAEKERYRSKAQAWRNRRKELEQQPEVVLVNEYVLATRLRTQGWLLDALQKSLAEKAGLSLLGSQAEELSDLLQDQEALGIVPVKRAETAELLATARLLQSPPPEDPALQYAVALLCRYGFHDEGERRFFSPALSPFRSDFQAICQEIVRPGRTVGEWLARLDFLDRYELDLPPWLANEASFFYTAALRIVPMEAKDWIPRLKGSVFGMTRSGTLRERIIIQAVLFAGHIPSGVELILKLLDHHEHCWQSVLSQLYVINWSDSHRLGDIGIRPLEALARRLTELLATDQSQPLFATDLMGSWAFHREQQIALGLAAILQVLEKAQASPPLIEQLHGDMCRMLDAGMQRAPETFSYVVFEQSVSAWLRARSDVETRQLFEQQIERFLRSLEEPDIDNTPFEQLGLLGQTVVGDEQSLPLNPEQWNRVTKVLLRHKASLLQALDTGTYRVRPLLWLASGLLGRKQPLLQDLARDLIRHSPPVPEALVAVVTASTEQLGDLADTIERAVLHCLHGLASESMPWFTWVFHSIRQPSTTETSEEIVVHGLGAVQNYLFFHRDAAPPSGWKSWLNPALAHCYSQNPQLATTALIVLESALSRVPDAVDMGAAQSALCWALASSDRGVRDRALFVARRHRDRLHQADTGALDEALKRFTPPPSISSAWIARLAALPADGK